MTLRTRIFIIVSLAVLFILGISLLLYISGKKAAAPVSPPATVNEPAVINTDVTPGLTPSVTPGEKLVQVKPATSEEQIQNAVRQWAKIFIERYGSYSSDNPGQNILDVKDLASDDLWAKIGSRINTTVSGGAFYGITTQVISAQLTEWAADTATVAMSTMRAENKNNVISNRQQDAVVVMTKIGEDWKVKSFTWGK